MIGRNTTTGTNAYLQSGLGHFRRSSDRRGTGSTRTGKVSRLIPDKTSRPLLEALEHQVQVGSAPETCSAYFDCAQQLPSCWCPYQCVLWVYSTNHVASFFRCFRRTSVEGVIFNIPPVIKVRLKNNPKNMLPGVVVCGGCYQRGRCLLACHTVPGMPFVFFLIPYIVPALLLESPPFHNPHQGPHCRHLSSLPTVRAFVCIAGTVQRFAPLVDSRRAVHTRAINRRNLQPIFAQEKKNTI